MGARPRTWLGPPGGGESRRERAPDQPTAMKWSLSALTGPFFVASRPRRRSSKYRRCSLDMGFLPGSKGGGTRPVTHASRMSEGVTSGTVSRTAPLLSRRRQQRGLQRVTDPDQHVDHRNMSWARDIATNSKSRRLATRTRTASVRGRVFSKPFTAADLRAGVAEALAA